MTKRLRALVFVVVLAGGCGGCGLTGGGDGSDGKGISAPPGPAWPGTASFVQVGIANTCAVATNGVGYCWGSNAEFQLTWPHTIDINPCSSASGGSSYMEWPCVGRAPVPVTGGLRWQTLTYSFQGPLCGVTSTGTVSCYSNFAADSSVVDYPPDTTSMMGWPLCGGIPCFMVPLPLKGGQTYTSFSWGFSKTFACGLGTSGTVYCVGGNGQNGALGSGTTIGETIFTPRAVAGDLVFTKLTVALTGEHACGLVADGTAYCWGNGSRGQLGVSLGSVAGAFPDGVPHPVVAVGGAQKFQWLSAGGNQTCALDMAGAATCWGQGAANNAAFGLSFTRLEVGVSVICGVDTAGDGWCWGENTYGQLGNGSNGTVLSTPVKVEGGHTWKTIVPGGEHTCGITTDDALYCWGRNTVGQLGAPSLWVGGTAAHSSVPVAVGH